MCCWHPVMCLGGRALLIAEGPAKQAAKGVRASRRGTAGGSRRRGPRRASLRDQLAPLPDEQLVSERTLQRNHNLTQEILAAAITGRRLPDVALARGCCCCYYY